MIDVQVVRDAYSTQEISNVGFIRGPDNPADGLTKTGKCQALQDILLTGKLNVKAEKWVIRKELVQPHLHDPDSKPSI